MNLKKNKALYNALISFLYLLLSSSCVNYKGSEGSVTSSLSRYSILSSQEKLTSLLTKDEYIGWYKANSERLRLSIDTMDLVYSTVFWPSELESIVSAESMNLPDSALDSLQKLKSSYSFFVFSVTSKSISQSKKIKDVSSSSYAMFDIQKDFFLVSGTDTLSCVLFIPVREKLTINGLLEYQIAFKKPKNIENITILYHDHLFGHGLKNFAFGNIVKESPQLKN